METISSVITNVREINLMQIGIYASITIVVILLAPIIAMLIVKMSRLKSQNKEKVSINPFYTSIIVLIRASSFYIFCTYIGELLQVSDIILVVVSKAILVVATISISKSLLNNFTLNSQVSKHIIKYSKKELKESMINFILKMIRCVIYIISGITVLSAIGVNVTSIITGLGFGSVLITLAAQDTAKNLFGGLMIFLDRPFEVGDWIKTDKYEGIVEDVTFRSTRIRLLDDAIANVPNAVITNAAIVNSSKLEKRRYKTMVAFPINTKVSFIEEFKAKLIEKLIEKEAVINDSIMLNVNKVQSSGSELEISMYIDAKEYNNYLQVEENINYDILELISKG